MLNIFIMSLIYVSLIGIIYINKETVNNYDNRMYKRILAINIIGILIDIVQSQAIKYGFGDVSISIINKSFLVYINVWTFTFTSYVLNIGISDDKRDKNILINITKVMFLVFVFLAVILPIHYQYDGIDKMYSYGIGADITYLAGLFYSVMMSIGMIANYKKVAKETRKKYIPLISFLFLGFFEAVVQIIHPELLLLSPFEAFITILTYFFIENPDMKMIEQLNIARDQADKANQAKSDFLSSMSHEIRTPLNAIVGFSQALQEEDLPPQAQDEVKDIVMASNGLLEIVNGILDISKIESGKIEIVNSEYSFKEVFDNLVALTKARLGDKPLDFRTHYDESIPFILYGDHTRIKQVALNILTNAVKYTKEGYIDFRVSSVVKDDVCRLIISVEDTGIGIKEKNIDKLFSKFERFDLEKNITIEGTGLGLAITKKLVDLMGGKIVVQSTYGKGSKFIIAIDQRIIHKEVVVKEAPEEVVAMPKQINVAGKNVLIVDDNKINLKVASRLLETYNLQIETLESGTSCIETITSGKVYDLILMDDMMPGLSGIETLHKLKENPNFSMPVVALTANAVSGMKEKYLSEGFNDYLSKPIDKEELKQIIVKYLNK